VIFLGGIVMSDDLGNKIKQIANMLGQDEVPDNLKSLVSFLADSLKKDESSSKVNDTVEKDNSTGLSKKADESRNEADESLEMIRKAKKVMEALNTTNDPRINLLNALKPFLNSTRQKRVNDCVKMLNMTRLVRLMEDKDILG